MAKRSDEEDHDLLLRALRALPPVRLAEEEDRRIAARAGACLATFSRRSRRAPRWIWPLLPLSIGGLTVTYLMWVVHQATLIASR
jgi:hypothetical protein